MATISEALETGIAHHQEGRLEEAAEIYRRILETAPSEARAWHLLGLVARQWGELDLAVQYMGRAVELNPGFAEAHSNLGDAWQQWGELARAEVCFRRAVELKPQFVEAHYNLGNVLKQGGRLEEAEGSYRRVLELAPEYVNAHNNLGHTLYEQGRYDEAGDCFRRALALDRNHAEAHGNLSHSLLLKGEFEAGWREYEWRWKSRDMRPREFEQPRWDGGPLAGKTILLHAEQGLGDTLQFVRYAAVVNHLEAQVVLECPAALKPLLASCAGVDRLIGFGEELPAFDVHAPLLSMPGIFKLTLETIPAKVPYLRADQSLVDTWREKLASVRGFRIGINWRGRTGTGSFVLRDIPLRCFAGLAALPDVRLISLQQGKGRQELAGAGEQVPILDLGENIDQEHGAFMDTAAIMKNLDLVITSDTSIPHLAGALGVPVWLALPFVPDWRWQLTREDSPWYPTMRLFRQKRAGDWEGVFEEIRAALAGKCEIASVREN
jgi:Flp pilus assembly protein TadD